MYSLLSFSPFYSLNDPSTYSSILPPTQPSIHPSTYFLTLPPVHPLIIKQFSSIFVMSCAIQVLDSATRVIAKDMELLYYVVMQSLIHIARMYVEETLYCVIMPLNVTVTWNLSFLFTLVNILFYL